MRLSSNQVLEIFLSSESTAMLGLSYSVSESTIRAIKRKKSHADITGQLSLFPGRPLQSNRLILTDSQVLEIYKFSGTIAQLRAYFGISKRVATNIKFGHTYRSITRDLGVPGELRLHSLTWDDVCTIRASTLESSILAQLFFVTRGTINNIRSGRTRAFK
jgi:hypothetical protein